MLSLHKLGYSFSFTREKPRKEKSLDNSSDSLWRVQFQGAPCYITPIFSAWPISWHPDFFSTSSTLGLGTSFFFLLTGIFTFWIISIAPPCSWVLTNLATAACARRVVPTWEEVLLCQGLDNICHVALLQASCALILKATHKWPRTHNELTLHELPV